MKSVVCLVLLLGVVAGSNDTMCQDSIITACRPASPYVNVHCNSIMGGFEAAHADLQVFANSLLAASFDYQLLAINFNTFENNQPGFRRVFQWLSDHGWEKGVETIKYITKRGGNAAFKEFQGLTKNGRKLELDALRALSLALDAEKKMLSRAHHIHRKVSRHDSHNHYDPSIANFIEEEFLNHQPDVIRKISGYVNDMKQLAESKDPSLAFYLFDEHLKSLSSVL